METDMFFWHAFTMRVFLACIYYESAPVHAYVCAGVCVKLCVYVCVHA